MRATAVGAALLLGAVLTGCADNTGQIDLEGHNGFDQKTCLDSKAFALDVVYGSVDPAKSADRINQITAESQRASDTAVKLATSALLNGYNTRNKQQVTTAVLNLVKACHL